MKSHTIKGDVQGCEASSEKAFGRKGHKCLYTVCSTINHTPDHSCRFLGLLKAWATRDTRLEELLITAALVVVASRVRKAWFWWHYRDLVHRTLQWRLAGSGMYQHESKKSRWNSQVMDGYLGLACQCWMHLSSKWTEWCEEDQGEKRAASSEYFEVFSFNQTKKLRYNVFMIKGTDPSEWKLWYAWVLFSLSSRLERSVVENVLPCIENRGVPASLDEVNGT